MSNNCFLFNFHKHPFISLPSPFSDFPPCSTFSWLLQVYIPLTWESLLMKAREDFSNYYFHWDWSGPKSMPVHVKIFVSIRSRRGAIYWKVVIGWIELTPYRPLTFHCKGWHNLKWAFDTGSRADSEHAKIRGSLSTDRSDLMIKSFNTICRRPFQGTPFI